MKMIYAPLLALVLLGCVHPTPTPRATANQPGPQGVPPAWKRSCLDYTPGPVSIDYQDAPNGASVIYRAGEGSAGLRVRADEIARFHNEPGSKIGDLHVLSSVPHRAHVEAIEGGVKLVLTAKSLRISDLGRLQRAVQQDVFVMQSRGCQAGQEAL